MVIELYTLLLLFKSCLIPCFVVKGDVNANLVCKSVIKELGKI